MFELHYQYLTENYALTAFYHIFNHYYVLSFKRGCFMIKH